MSDNDNKPIGYVVYPNVSFDDVVKLQAENAKLKEEVERLRTLYKDTAIALVANGGKADNENIEKDINKIKADAILKAKESFVASHEQGVGVFGEGFNEAIVQYDSHLDKYADKVEKGND